LWFRIEKEQRMKRVFIAALLAATLPAAATAGPGQGADGSLLFLNEQQTNEWRMYNYIGQPVFNADGTKVGVVHDVMFEQNGKVTAVVISVGGFLGMGAKLVGVPFQAITYVDKNGVRQITIPLTKEKLMHAPDYALTERTRIDKVRDKTEAAAEKAGEKASDLKDRAMQKIDEYTK
jgi:sporulation protein YlmC with PRC-barrel domain